MRKPLDWEILHSDWVPYGLIAVGLLLAGVMLAEVIAIAVLPIQITIIEVANFLTSIPFVVLLVGGGYWLLQSNIPTERYPRIAVWTILGLVFLTGFFAIISLREEGLLLRTQIIRWGAANGAGAGVLVGIFEARAIHGAVRSERTRVRNEELQKQSERLEEFATIVSHDLRNPLNVAVGRLDLAREDSDSEHLDILARALDRMDTIIKDTLTLARQGQAVGETEPVEIEELVESSWEMVQTNGASLNITNIGRVKADPNRLRHVFENLIRNALEHGSPNVSIRVGRLENGAGFYVEDDGPGVPVGKREEIFKPGQTSQSGQTGFGLTIVKRMVEAHGWDIRVTEGAEGGARFEITGVEWVDN